MSQITRVSGDAAGVANYDVANYVNGLPVGTGVTINPQGPGLSYLAVYFGADLVDADFGVGGPVEAVIRTLQQVGVVATYEAAAIQLNTTPADVQRCSKFAMYPAGLIDTEYSPGVPFVSGLESAIRALGTIHYADPAGLLSGAILPPLSYDLSGAEVIASSFGA